MSTHPETGREPLILRHESITGKVEALFAAMAKAPDLQRQFVKDPAQVIHLQVTGKRLPPQRASVSNQLLYSILSNAKLLKWVRDYAEERRGKPPTRHEFITDFSRAVIKHSDDDHVVIALIRAAAAEQSALGLGSDQAFFITSSPFIASGYIVRTDEKTGLAQDQRNISSFPQNTQQSVPATQLTNTNSGSSMTATGTGSDTSSDVSSSASSDVSADSSSDAESDVGSDTGSDTGSETGTGTSSEGLGFGNLGIFGSQYVRTTVEALVAYAIQLRENGALNVTANEQISGR